MSGISEPPDRGIGGLAHAMRTTMALVVDAVHYIFVAMTIQPEIGLRGARLTQKATPDGTMRRFVTEQSLQIWAAKGGTWGEESAARPVECAKSQKRRPLSRGDPDQPGDIQAVIAPLAPQHVQTNTIAHVP